MLVMLSVITYLDRVCINAAADAMSEELAMTPSQLGWVFSIFAIAYGIFEIPGGWMGDRFGPRIVLTRIVVWWSAFTALTGVVTGYIQLLVVRFLFGAGEAGAYPNTSSAISRWFPAHERARSHGWVWMASRLGGAASPLIVAPLLVAFGWAFGLLSVFHIWHRVGGDLVGVVSQLPRREGRREPSRDRADWRRQDATPRPELQWDLSQQEPVAHHGDVPLLLLRLLLVPGMDDELPDRSERLRYGDCSWFHPPCRSSWGRSPTSWAVTQATDWSRRSA